MLFLYTKTNYANSFFLERKNKLIFVDYSSTLLQSFMALCICLKCPIWKEINVLFIIPIDLDFLPGFQRTQLLWYLHRWCRVSYSQPCTTLAFLIILWKILQAISWVNREDQNNNTLKFKNFVDNGINVIIVLVF